MANKKFIDHFLEKYVPKDEAGKRFVKKHAVAKTKDVNGNKDDVFNAKNIKMFDRHLEHGYNPGEDEAVYEAVEPLDELSTKTLASYVKKASYDAADRAHSSATTRGRLSDKFADDEFSQNYKKDLMSRTTKNFNKAMSRLRGVDKAASKLAKEEAGDYEDDEGWYAHSEMFGSKGINRHDWKKGWRLSRSGKRVNIKTRKEEVEPLEELSRNTLMRYVRKSGEDIHDKTYDLHDTPRNAARKKIRKRISGTTLAAQKLGGNRMVVGPTKEEVEQIDELSRKTLGSYTYKSALDMTDKYMKYQKDGDRKKLTKSANRQRGIRAATRKLAKEDAENLDELSKETLVKYIHHATGNASVQGGRYARAVDKGMPATKAHSAKKIKQRQQGVTKAAARLAYSQGQRMKQVITIPEEAEQIDELSGKTLRGYIDKSLSDVHNAGYKSGESFTKGNMDGVVSGTLKSIKRQMGIKKAAKKLAKEDIEDTELQELSDKTLKSYREKAGKQYHDAKAAIAIGGGDWSKDGSTTKTLVKRYKGGKLSKARLRQREYEKTQELRSRPSDPFSNGEADK